MLRIRVVALGHRMPAWVDAGWDDYRRRLPREIALELVELKPEPRDRGIRKAIGATRGNFSRTVPYCPSCSRPRRCGSARPARVPR